MGVTVERIDFKYLDIAVRHHPERSGRYIPLTTLLYFVATVRHQPDGLAQIEKQLLELVKA